MSDGHFGQSGQVGHAGQVGDGGATGQAGQGEYGGQAGRVGRRFEGSLVARGRRFAVVVARFNEFISERLLEGALDALVRHGAAPDAIDVFRVPGSFELPFAARRVARKGNYDAVVCLGALIRGATPHFEFIAAETAKGLAQVALETDVPVSFGVVTADTLEQAIERAGAKAGNKGFDAALAAIEMVNLLEGIASA